MAKSDWIAEWKKWILNAHPSPVGRQNGGTPADHRRELLAMASLLEMQRGNDEPEPDFLDRVEAANDRRIADICAPETVQ